MPPAYNPRPSRASCPTTNPYLMTDGFVAFDLAARCGASWGCPAWLPLADLGVGCSRLNYFLILLFPSSGCYPHPYKIRGVGITAHPVVPAGYNHLSCHSNNRLASMASAIKSSAPRLDILAAQHLLISAFFSIVSFVGTWAITSSMVFMPLIALSADKSLPSYSFQQMTPGSLEWAISLVSTRVAPSADFQPIRLDRLPADNSNTPGAPVDWMLITALAQLANSADPLPM